MNSKLFSSYFNNAPVLTIPGRTFPVRALYLEHALELTAHTVVSGSDWARPRPGGKGGIASALLRDEERTQREAPMAERDDELLSLTELRERYRVPSEDVSGSAKAAAASSRGGTVVAAAAADEVCFSESTAQALFALDHTSIDFGLIVELVLWFVRQRQARLQQLPADATDAAAASAAPAASKRPASAVAERTIAPNAFRSRIAQAASTLDGSILIFLPGLKEITTLYELLLGNSAIRQLHADQSQWLFPLHSTLSSEDQLRVFSSPPRAQRVGAVWQFAQKVVIATNIAETRYDVFYLHRIDF